MKYSDAKKTFFFFLETTEDVQTSRIYLERLLCAQFTSCAHGLGPYCSLKVILYGVQKNTLAFLFTTLNVNLSIDLITTVIFTIL